MTVAFLKTLSSNDAPVAMPRLPAYDQTVAGSVSGISPAAGPADGNTPKTGCNTLFSHWQPCDK